MIWRGMISEVRRSRTPVLAACLAVTAVLSPLPGRASEPRRAMEASPLSLHFVASPLEANEEARFVARMSGLSARFARNNVTFRVRGQDIQIGFVGANPTPDMTGEERLAVRTHYFLGNEPGGWRADLPAFRSIVYHELYPGIDLRYSGDGERLKSDFMIAPGADPAAIHLRYPDEMTLRIGEGGGLIVAGAGVELREDIPAIYQEVAGQYPSNVLVENNSFVRVSSPQVDIPGTNITVRNNTTTNTDSTIAPTSTPSIAPTAIIYTTTPQSSTSSITLSRPSLFTSGPRLTPSSRPLPILSEPILAVSFLANSSCTFSCT